MCLFPSRSHFLSGECAGSSVKCIFWGDVELRPRTRGRAFSAGAAATCPRSLRLAWKKAPASGSPVCTPSISRRSKFSPSSSSSSASPPRKPTRDAARAGLSVPEGDSAGCFWLGDSSGGRRPVLAAYHVCGRGFVRVG